METVGKNLPGILLCAGIGVVSIYLGGQIPLVGGPVFALMLGIVLNLFNLCRKGL